MILSIPKMIVAATLVSGTLDIVSAFVFGGMAGVGPARILKYIASGPFGEGTRDGGAGAAALGLAVHFTLMAIMVTLFVVAASKIEAMRRYWPVAGVFYGLCIYLVMYWVVLPARFGHYPVVSLWKVGNALFSHFFCVGLPMAWITSRGLGRT
jgi:hypothetical protein